MSGPHLSQLVLFRILAGERVGLDEARAHLAECEICQAALEALRAQRAEWRAATDREAFLAPVVAQVSAEVGEDSPDRDGPRKSEDARILPFPLSRWTAAMAAAAAAVAGLYLVNVAPPEEVGLKGGPSLAVVVVEDGRSRPLGSDEQLRAGDRIGFVARCPAGCALQLVSGGPSPQALGGRFTLQPGVPFTLPFTATLDDAKTDEQVSAVFCDDSSGLAAALEMPSGPPAPGCVTRRVEIRRGD